MTVEKYTDARGQVAVLYSPGYGAGWSSGLHMEEKEFALFDAGLVQFVLDGTDVRVVEAYIEDKLGDAYFYMGGWPLEIEWLAPGTQFTIHEYDGNETVQLIRDLSCTA